MTNTIEQCKAKAMYLINLYPNAKNVQDLINTAKADGHFQDSNDLLAVWGRVCRLLPQKENN